MTLDNNKWHYTQHKPLKNLFLECKKGTKTEKDITNFQMRKKCRTQ